MVAYRSPKAPVGVRISQLLPFFKEREDRYDRYSIRRSLLYAFNRPWHFWFLGFW